ncbi:MAG TPA: chromate transporter [Sutterella sp.]|nr:chromate transporter [Sutterella sp.]
MKETLDKRAPASLGELFWTFFVLALQCFGGALTVVQRGLIEEKRWYTKLEYVEMFALIQAIPGPNVCKIIIMTGYNYFGIRGAIVALAGFTLMPYVVTVAMALVVEQFIDYPQVAGALHGILAAASGMGIGGALSLAETYREHPVGPFLWILGAVITFVLFAFVRVPLVWVLLGCGGPWVYMTWRVLKRRKEAAHD